MSAVPMSSDLDRQAAPARRGDPMDHFIASIREALDQIATHDHPHGLDLYCLNLRAWMGERMAGVLKRYDEAAAEARSWRGRADALADELLAEHLRSEDLAEALGQVGPKGGTRHV